MTTWFPILGAPAAWLLQVLILWLVTTWNCPGDGPTRTIVFVVSAVALIVALGACVGSATAWRRSDNSGIREIEGWTRSDFAAASAVMISSVFTLAIIAATLPAFLLSVCEPMR